MGNRRGEGIKCPGRRAGEGEQGGPTEGSSSPQGLLCAPNAPSPERAMWQTGGAGPGPPHFSERSPHAAPLALRQGDGHDCFSGWPLLCTWPWEPGQEQVQTGAAGPGHGGRGGGGSVRCSLPNPPDPAPRRSRVTCASPGLPRGTLPPALSTGDWRLWAASAAP